MNEWKNENEITIKDLVEILQTLDQSAIVKNGKENNIRIYPGRENKSGGKAMVMLC